MASDSSVLAETWSSSTCLTSRMPPCQGELGLRCSSGPLKKTSVDGAGRATGQTEPGSRHAILEQCPLRRVDTPPTNGSGNMGNLQVFELFYHDSCFTGLVPRCSTSLMQYRHQKQKQCQEASASLLRNLGTIILIFLALIICLHLEKLK